MQKYLYTVVYEDGTGYEQNTEDISVTNPEKSCYYDIDIDRVKIFSLKGDGIVVGVYLTSGEFFVNGVMFKMYENPLDKYELRLIFFRKHTHTFSQGIETDHNIVYRFGWQFTDANGHNIQRIMEII
jgi:hypothetical protein